MVTAGVGWNGILILTVPCLVPDSQAASELHHQLYHLTKVGQALWVRAGLGGGQTPQGGFEKLKAFTWESES